MVKPTIETKHYKQMNELAKMLDETFNGKNKGKNRKYGFMLSVFPFGNIEGGRFNYISNADKKNIVTLLKEMVVKFEKEINC